MFISLDKKNRHRKIVKIQKTVGVKFAKPLVVFKNPFEKNTKYYSQNKIDISG